VTVSLLNHRASLASGAAPLEALAEARERLIEASVRLQSRPGSVRVESGVDCRGYQSGSTFEMFVEAEFDAAFTLTWWLEITWDRSWNISARLLRDDDDGQTVVREFGGRSSADAIAFVGHLAETVDEVVDSIEHWGDHRE
jgi:hypothetical protein